MHDPSTPEEKYFKEQEARLRESMREELEKNARTAREKRAIAESLGSDDAAVVDRIHALGLDGDVVHVLHLLPLVEIAWADGTVQANERATILEAAEAHGVSPGSPGATFLASLLETRPSETLLAEVLELLHDILRARGMHPKSVLDACRDVASASGGLLGFGSKISDEERKVIERLASSISPASARKVTERLE